MLHGQVRDFLSRALIVAAALAACSPAAPWLEAARADVAQVTVVAPGGTQQALSLDALGGQEDVRDRSYVLRSTAGESTHAVTGFSLERVLEAAGADPYGFSYLEVQRPAGGAVLLSRHQALDPGAFAEGPPVVYATAAGTGFLRPSSGAEDLNATDSFEAPQGITLVLRKGSPLQVKAEVSPQQAKPGQPVSFSAVVERAGAGEQLTYSWYFDDGHSAAGASVSHSFARRGSYDVVVGVTTPGDSAGASAVVTVQVGAPLSGPDRKGGGNDRDADAPDHGAATGTRGTVAPGPAVASPGSGAGVAPTDAQRGRRPRVRRSNTGTALREAAAGEPVVGELVSATAPIDAAKPAVAARTGKLSGEGDGPGLPGAALGILVTAGLLGLGALVELRSSFVWPGATNSERGGVL
ncbi:MAG TPA: PKD domain-containing protein [Solirubrobacterales bacterium]|nr:PKD domain-containing protein [Solirubrobacterales bacterium]